MTPAPRPPRMSTLVLMGSLGVLSLNMFLPSLPSMTRDLGTTESVTALAISLYMVVQAVLQVILGPVSDRIGRRPVALTAFALYAGASLGCALAPDIASFLVFRMVQGLSAAGMVLSSAVIRDCFPPREAAARLGAVAATMALAPMVGPMLGGMLDTALGWRAIFALYTLLGVATLAVTWRDLSETRDGTRPLARRQDYGALLGAGRFWAYVLCQGFSIGSFFVFLAGAPFVAAQLYGLSTAWIGVGLGSITGGYMLGATITARLATRLGIARLLIAGRLVSLFGLTLGLVLFAAGLSHPALLFGTTLFVGFGNGLTVSNANAGALSVRPDLAGTAAGLGAAIVTLGGAALTTLSALAMGISATPMALLSMMLASVLASLLAGWLAIRSEAAAA